MKLDNNLLENGKDIVFVEKDNKTIALPKIRYDSLKNNGISLEEAKKDNFAISYNSNLEKISSKPAHLKPFSNNDVHLSNSNTNDLGM